MSELSLIATLLLWEFVIVLFMGDKRGFMKVLFMGDKFSSFVKDSWVLLLMDINAGSVSCLAALANCAESDNLKH